MALSLIGAQRINALTDQSKNARELNAIFEFYRESELRAHNWGFAIRRVKLPALVETPPFGYNRYYQLPPDFLKLIQAGDRSPGVSLTNYRIFSEQEYAIEGDRIAWGPLGSTGASTTPGLPLPIRYIARITDPTKFDALFVTAFAARLGMEVCEQITGSSDKDTKAAAAYDRALSDALKSNAIEKPPSPLPDSSWIMTRLS
jgi:hypothetical protein